MRRIGAALMAATAVLAITAGSTLAIPVPGTLDVHQDVATGASATWNSNFYLAQGFTAGVTGKLDAVGVFIGETAPPPGPNVQPALLSDTEIHIEATPSGTPGGSYIASGTLTIDTTPGWVYWILSPAIDLTAGSKYTIQILTGGSNVIDWAGDCAADDYTGGAAYVEAVPLAFVTVKAYGTAHSVAEACQFDFAFQTYMTPPGSTLPPTSSIEPARTATEGSPAVILIFCGLAAAAAFVTVRRYGLARR